MIVQSSAMLFATFVSLVVPFEGRAQDAMASCATASRPARYAAEIAAIDTGLSARALDPLIPMLMSPTVVDIHTGAEVRDAGRDALKAGLDSIAAQDSLFLQVALVQILRIGIDGHYPLWAANAAASRFRWESGRAGPVLLTLRHQASDRFLLPLSALSGDLDAEEEEFVFAVTCDVALPLLAVRRTVGPDSAYSALVKRLE